LIDFLKLEELRSWHSLTVPIPWTIKRRYYSLLSSTFSKDLTKLSLSRLIG